MVCSFYTHTLCERFPDVYLRVRLFKKNSYLSLCAVGIKRINKEVTLGMENG